MPWILDGQLEIFNFISERVNRGPGLTWMFDISDFSLSVYKAAKHAVTEHNTIIIVV